MLQFPCLAEDCNIFHFVTTRQGGVSEGSYGSFNLGAYAGDNPEYVEENRNRLCQVMGIKPSRLLVPCQVHEDQIAIIDEEFLSKDLPLQTHLLAGKDALVTALPGVCLAVTTADCVPVILYDPLKQVVAVAHAGWRGTAKRIVSKVVLSMQRIYDSDPADILAGIGPCIGPDAFEVGEEVIRAFEEVELLHANSFYRHPVSGKGHIDLAAINQQQLTAGGLNEEHVFQSGICTYQSDETFFSARRLGVQSGRLLTGIYLK